MERGEAERGSAFGGAGGGALQPDSSPCLRPEQFRGNAGCFGGVSGGENTESDLCQFEFGLRIKSKHAVFREGQCGSPNLALCGDKKGQ